MQIHKSIQLFLQKNNLTQTLHIFKNQCKKRPNKTQTQTNSTSTLHKFTLATLNAGQIREHYQKTDPNVLRKAIRRLKKRANNNTNNNSNNLNIKNVSNPQQISKLPFFRRLVQKQNRSLQNVNQQYDEFSSSSLNSSRMTSTNPLQQSKQYQNQWEVGEQVGYEVYECEVNELGHYSDLLAKQTKNNAIKSSSFPEQYYLSHQQKIQKRGVNLKDGKSTRLPPKTIFKKQQNQDTYPIQHNGITYDTYQLKIIYDRQKTGLQQDRQLPIVINQVLAARYQVVSVLGQAAFSKVIQVIDLDTNKHMCIKIIQNSNEESSKQYLDQSIDEIKMLRLLSNNCNPEQSHLLAFQDFFYHREHLMIVTELLSDSLLDAYTMHPSRFQLKTVQNFAKQILLALDKLQSLHIIHTDLKPQNILIKSYSKQQIKVIDLGSSIFFHDSISFYIQTRSYRAPQIILGCPYDHKIDIWSLGCILFQIFTGEVLFASNSSVDLLAKMQGLRGPWPSWMIQKGKYSKDYFTQDLIPFEEVQMPTKANSNRKICRLYVPKLTNLKARLNNTDDRFSNFLSKCLKLDPSERISVKQALKHPFIMSQI